MRVLNNQKTGQIKTIRSITKDVRKQRIENDHGLEYETVQKELATGEHHDPLLGECQQNTISLADKLTQHEYDIHVIWGVLEQPQYKQNPHTTPPSNIKEIQSNIHFWVEIPTEEIDIDSGKFIIAEICKEPTGQWQVTPKLPDNYHRPEESRIKYEQDKISLNHLKSYSGYQQLAKKGLVIS